MVVAIGRETRRKGCSATIKFVAEAKQAYNALFLDLALFINDLD
jgi:hypothetical protein